MPLALLILALNVHAAELSHPPLRTVLPAPAREIVQGPNYFVDATKGDDEGDGAEASPWRTLQHAIDQLAPGDTLYLRGGTYYENVRISLHGAKDAPITICSYPGEQSVLDGGAAEFL